LNKKQVISVGSFIPVTEHAKVSRNCQSHSSERSCFKIGVKVYKTYYFMNLVQKIKILYIVCTYYHLNI